MNDSVLLSVLAECAHRLGHAVQTVETTLSMPVITDVTGQKQYRYDKQSPCHVAFLKGVRIVSGLNACLCLLKGGYTQEVMVIVRTLDDFTGEMIFILENAESGALSKQQEKFIKDFFKEEFINPNNPLLNEERRATVPKKNIWASLARLLGPCANPSDLQKMCQVTNDALSGYVHGAYPHIMEMLGLRPARFCVEGMRGSRKISACVRQLQIYMHRSIVAFDVLAKCLGLAALTKFLNETLDYFEKESGYAQPAELNKAIRSLKERS